MTHDELKRGDLVELVDGTGGQEDKTGWVGVVVKRDIGAANTVWLTVNWMWGGDGKHVGEGGYYEWRFRKRGEAELAD